MAETVLKALELAILTGELKPRERLTELELVRRFKAKRFAVRKAIQELSYRGLVELFPNKGARVADISDKEVEDAYQVRMALELLAADLLVKRMTPAKLAQLKKIQREYLDAVKRGTIEEMVLKNEAFHRTLYQMTENRFLAEHLERITNAIFALRYNAYFLLGIAPKTVKDHEAMIEALERRDAEGFKKALREGIIYPKMIYLSRRMNPFSADRSKKRSREGEKGRDKGARRYAKSEKEVVVQ